MSQRPAGERAIEDHPHPPWHITITLAKRLPAEVRTGLIKVGCRGDGGGGGSSFVQLDLTDAKSIQRAAEWIDAEYGRLDILVNNAGTAPIAGRGYIPPGQTSLDDMRARREAVNELDLAYPGRIR